VSPANAPEFGVAVDQEDSSPALHAWVPLRRAILKRPALATVEKFIDVVPGLASIFISSAFHPAYVDKMIGMAEARGYEGYIIVSKGVEGSIGLGLGRGTLHVGARNSTGLYTRSTVTAPPVAVDEEADVEAPEKGFANCGRSVRRIRMWIDSGSSGDKCFDMRVKATIEAFDGAMTFLLRSSMAENVASRRSKERQ
jgi:hypothetical protein